jgi:hypothetical protein
LHVTAAIERRDRLAGVAQRGPAIVGRATFLGQLVAQALALGANDRTSLRVMGLIEESRPQRLRFRQLQIIFETPLSAASTAEAPCGSHDPLQARHLLIIGRRKGVSNYDQSILRIVLSSSPSLFCDGVSLLAGVLIKPVQAHYQLGVGEPAVLPPEFATPGPVHAIIDSRRDLTADGFSTTDRGRRRLGNTS